MRVRVGHWVLRSARPRGEGTRAVAVTLIAERAPLPSMLPLTVWFGLATGLLEVVVLLAWSRLDGRVTDETLRANRH